MDATWSQGISNFALIKRRGLLIFGHFFDTNEGAYRTRSLAWCATLSAFSENFVY